MPDQSDSSQLLNQLKIGQIARILDFTEDNAITQRLEEMGINPGEEITVVRFAPLGDPIEIKIRGYLLTLRRDEANLIKVSS
jgi:ferrous iron transport protein A